MRLLGALLLVSLFLTACPGRAQTTTSTTLPPTTPDQLCPASGDPCTVSGPHAVNSGSTLDFGARALVLSPNASLTVSAGGVMGIKAASLALGQRAALVAAGGAIAVEVTGPIQLTSGASIDVSAPSAGRIDLTAGTTVTLGGALDAFATDLSGDGGIINVTAGGNLVVADGVTAGSGGQGSGGDVSIVSHGSITVNRPIDASGGEFDGGTIDLEADGDLTVNQVARLDVSALNGGLSGNGGTVTLSSNVRGDIRFFGAVNGRAKGSDPNTAEGGGDGGEIDILTANGSITVDASSPIAMLGGMGDGGGGTVDFEALNGNLVVTQTIAAAGNGIDSCGGTVTLIAGQDLTFKAVDASGGSCGSASVTAVAGGTVTVPAEINADGSAGTIQITGKTAAVTGNVHASGGVGLVNVQGCSLTVTSTGKLVTAGDQGTNLVQAAGQMVIAGRLTAGAANQLRYLDPSKPPLITCSGCIAPLPDIAQDPTVPDLCATTTTTTSTTPVPSTTSTTLPLSTTTTTLASATTSSTIVRTTSTTTAPTASTTSTTLRAPAQCAGGCDDGDPCTTDACVQGTCDHTPREGFDAVTCRLDGLTALVSAAPSTAIRPALRQKLLAKIGKLGTLVEKGRTGGARGARALRRADRGAAALTALLERSRGKIDASVGGRLAALASGAKSRLDGLVTP